MRSVEELGHVIPRPAAGDPIERKRAWMRAVQLCELAFVPRPKPEHGGKKERAMMRERPDDAKGKRTMRHVLSVVTLLVLLVSGASAHPVGAKETTLYVWAGDAARQQ